MVKIKRTEKDKPCKHWTLLENWGGYINIKQNRLQEKKFCQG
jgi:hypothetical protein